MKIWVSSLSRAQDTFAEAAPSAAVSLLSPGDEFPDFDRLRAEAHHRVHLHDIREPREGHVTPGEAHVTSLVSFLERWDPDTGLLVHCWAGISRSTATAFIAACLHNPQADERAIAREIRAASPTAWPNTLIVAHADRLLGRGGRMEEAVADMGEWTMAEEARPFSIPTKF